MKKELPDADPAFPVTIESREEGSATYFGMSMRDWFAGMALTAAVESTGPRWETAAETAYAIADAMLRARNRTE